MQKTLKLRHFVPNEHFPPPQCYYPTQTSKKSVKPVVKKAIADQAPLTSAQAQAIARLGMHVSHFHQVYDLGIERGHLPAAGRAYYGREVRATTIPALTAQNAVLAAAESIVKGEAYRQTAEGAAFKPMGFPSAAVCVMYWDQQM